MKPEQLMACIGQIDDAIIEEANGATSRKPAKSKWIKWAVAGVAAAACLGIVLLPAKPQQADPVIDETLPKLTVDFGAGGYGFEGYMAYDISELETTNPWTKDNNLATLPVFANPGEYDMAGALLGGLSAEEMLAEAENVANLLSVQITALYTNPTAEEAERMTKKLEAMNAQEEELRQITTIYQAVAECDGAKITVERDGAVTLELTEKTAELAKKLDRLSGYDSLTVSFDFENETIGDTMYGAGLPLPNGYKFSYEDTTNEQALQISQYLFAQYGAFSGISTPGYDLFADYTFSGTRLRTFTFAFENEGELTERILNYHFDRLYFGATDLGGLGNIRHQKTDLSNKIGDYPIITAQEAEALLLENHYLTTVPEEFPGKQYIASVELIYRTGRLDAVFMPYYKFLVEMPTLQQENGLKLFGAFYVPAVQADYLEEVPVWNGSFN